MLFLMVRFMDDRRAVRRNRVLWRRGGRHRGRDDGDIAFRKNRRLPSHDSENRGDEIQAVFRSHRYCIILPRRLGLGHEGWGIHPKQNVAAGSTPNGVISFKLLTENSKKSKLLIEVASGRVFKIKNPRTVSGAGAFQGGYEKPLSPIR
jgi:hypothetical protein